MQKDHLVGGDGGGVRAHTPKPLTKPQKRLLWAACKNGGVRRSASSRRPAEALETAGLATVLVEVQADALRGRHRLFYVVTATPQGRLVAYGANALINLPAFDYSTSQVKAAVDATYDQDYMDDYGRRASTAKVKGGAA